MTRTERLALALAFLAPAAIHLPSVGLGFSPSDDPIHLDYAAATPWLGLFTQARPDLGILIFYRPLLHGLLKTSLTLFGWEALPIRLALVAAHAGCAGLLFLLARRIGIGTWIALAAAWLFTTHPSTAKTIPWVSNLSYPASLFLSLAAVHAFLEYRRTGSRGDGACALGFFVVATLFKETAYATLAAIAVVPWMGAGRANPREVKHRGEGRHGAGCRGEGRGGAGPRGKRDSILAPAHLLLLVPFLLWAAIHFFLLESPALRAKAWSAAGGPPAGWLASLDALVMGLAGMRDLSSAPQHAGAAGLLGVGVLLLVLGAAAIRGRRRARALAVWTLAILAPSVQALPFHGAIYAALPPILLLLACGLETLCARGLPRILAAGGPLLAAVLLAPGVLVVQASWRRVDAAAREIPLQLHELSASHPDPAGSIALVEESVLYNHWIQVVFGADGVRGLARTYAPRFGHWRFLPDLRRSFLEQAEARGREGWELGLEGLRRVRAGDPPAPGDSWVPEFYFARGAEVARSSRDAWQRVLAADFDPWRVVLDGVPPRAPPPTGPGTVQGKKRRWDGWELIVEVEAPALLVWCTAVFPAADPFQANIDAPWGPPRLLGPERFEARIEDRRLPRYRANVYFTAFAVPAGFHRVRLVEDRPTFFPEAPRRRTGGSKGKGRGGQQGDGFGSLGANGEGRQRKNG